MIRIGSLFSGIDGLALGVQLATLGQVVWHAEIDKDACQVLTRHWRCPNLGDITKVEWGGHMRVDILVGGFPCQDVSQAGKGAGIDGARSGLWREIVRCVRALRPGLLFVENVAALLVRGFDRVAADLAACGYRFAWSSYSSAAVGAPHRRDRIFILAAPDNHSVGGGAPNASGLAGQDGVAVGHNAGGWCAAAHLPGERRQGAAEGTEAAGRGLALQPAPDGDGYGWSGVAASDGSDGCVDVEPRNDADGRGTYAPDIVGGRCEGRTWARQGNAEPLHDGRYPARFGPAIQRWERIVGRAAPSMAVAGARGGSVLNPAFSEWMMGFPPGWTAGVSRTARLRLVGNAVQPQVAEAAFRGLRERLFERAVAA